MKRIALHPPRYQTSLLALVIASVAIIATLGCAPRADAQHSSTPVEESVTTSSAEQCANNEEHETGGCPCATDSDCTCRFYDGDQFQDRVETSRCDVDLGVCVTCIYD